jgi:hypothetical protein
MMDYIESLMDAIRSLHGCEATYLETVPVTEIFQGKIAWQGDVEVFNIRGHPKAKRCYAWAHDTDNASKRYVAVLELPPVDSAQKAVRAAIIQEIRGIREKQKGKKR